MSGIAALNGAHGSGRVELAKQLARIADEAARAATFADGEYLPQMSRSLEVRTAFGGAGRAAQLLEDLKPRIAVLDGGEDGLRLAQRAIDDLQAGRQALRGAVSIEDDVIPDGAVVADAIATGSAGSLFRDAAAGVRGVADMATFEATSAGDLFLAITRLTR